MRYPIYLLFNTLLFFANTLLAQEAIVGSSHVYPFSITSYSIASFSYDWVEWRLEPKGAGIIITEPKSSRIKIQWNGETIQDSTLSNLMALVRIPNSEKTLNFLYKITLLKPQKDPFEDRGKKTGFSKYSKDSLRFYYRMICQSLGDERTIELRDSSLQKQKAIETSWFFRNTVTNDTIKRKDNPLTMTLSPGKYRISLYHVYGNRKDSLTDTLTIYPSPTASFNLSNTSPCKASLITLTNTSTDQKYSQYSIFHFGDGSVYKLIPSQKTVYYKYEGPQALVMTPHLELIDLHGCSVKSKETAITIKDNKFSLNNITIEPHTYIIKKEGDKVKLNVVMGVSTSPANPNGPFTYAWSNGKTGQSIDVSQGGNYSVKATDSYGCTSKWMSAVIVQNYKEKDRPVVIGPTHVKAGTKIEFKMMKKEDYLYQWKFLFNGSPVLTTAPSKSSSIEAPGWEHANPGILSTIGIIMKNTDDGVKSSYSDTLITRIE